MDDSVQLLDWEQLDMVAFGYTQDFLEIYAEFLDQTPHLLAEVAEAERRGEVQRVADLAHKIKGSALNFGFSGVSSPMAEVEAHTKAAANLEGAADRIAQAMTNFERAKAEVAKAKSL
jgi:HPt (histidine-containing phosphotransfer) domain-containing protein